MIFQKMVIHFLMVNKKQQYWQKKRGGKVGMAVTSERNKPGFSTSSASKKW
jgi:hypothetical protein